MSKQVSLPKISSILQKNENRPKFDIRPFCTKAFNYGTMLSMSKQVGLPKISSFLQKMKIGQNLMYALFAQSPSIKNNLILTHC